MGLLSSVLGKKNKQKKEKTPFENNDTLNENIDYEEKINTIILVMGNLGLLNVNEIEKCLEEASSYDKNIFEKIKIIIPSSNYQYLSKYVKASSLGYGELKQAEIVYSLKKIITIEEEKEKSSQEILKELLFATKLDISRYKSILSEFDETISKIDSDITLTELDKVSMIDYWISFYKVEKLGFSVDVESKMNSLIKSLKELEYDGYGPKEIAKFEERCQIELEKSKTEDKNVNQIIKEIESKIYEPLKSKYLNDLSVLKRRISIVENSKVISSSEKEQQKQEFIIDFNERNGHKIDISDQLLAMKKNLANLKYGGYGLSSIDDFENFSQNLIISGKQKKLSDKSILASIKIEYNKYIAYYTNKVQELESKLNNSKSEKEQQEFIVEFQKEMTSPIDFNKKLVELKEKNKESIEETRVNELVEKCNEIISTNKREYTPQFETLAEIEQLESNYQETSEIDIYSKKLKEIGYGSEAVAQFIEDCKNLTILNKTEEERILIIKNKFRILENNYFYNKKLFTLWKEQELKKATTEEKKLELEQITKHLLSLSPKDLNLYYEEDKNKKQEFMDNHNFKLAFTYLAKKEAEENNDSTLITKRLNDLASGINPYNEEELSKAKEALIIKELLDVNKELTKEEKLITKAEYIDSTLYKQILTIETKNFLSSNNKEENIAT